jgi:hypothetical protein
MSDVKPLNEFEGQEYIDAVRSAFDAGEPLRRDHVIKGLGQGDGWWDMFGPLDPAIIGEIAMVTDKLKPGEAAKCDKALIPEPIWTRHRAKFTDPTRHGLKLQDEPAAIAAFRYDDDSGVGLLIGYAQA